ncbi:hypothetical protein GCM10010394_48080 [Streptomyces crystallinus]|uniref:Uncharacterized protein n=1 Tax=Streptomyces crystallinus TaxID=68191 RepID=A0ABP3RL57_9ACTN
MRTRHSAGYDNDQGALNDLFAHAQSAEGSEVSHSRCPLRCPTDAWDVRSMMHLLVPGIGIPLGQ